MSCQKQPLMAKRWGTQKVATVWRSLRFWEQAHGFPRHPSSLLEQVLLMFFIGLSNFSLGAWRPGTREWTFQLYRRERFWKSPKTLPKGFDPQPYKMFFSFFLHLQDPQTDFLSHGTQIAATWRRLNPCVSLLNPPEVLFGRLRAAFGLPFPNV